MKLIHNSLSSKVFGVLRFIVVKIFYFRKMKTSGISLFGKGLNYFIEKRGEVSHDSRNVFGLGSYVYSQGTLSFGKRFFLNNYSRIVCHDKISIGDDVTIASFVTIIDHDHAYNFKQGKLSLDGYITDPITIGNNVWISEKVTILKGVNIGNNVIIAANSVVNKSVPENVIVGGVPAKIISSIAK